MIHHISTDQLKRMGSSDGLILQGCGGDPAEWQKGINEMLTEAGILKNGGEFKDIYVFEYEGITNIYYPFDDMKPDTLDMGRLAMWRLQTHDNFGGTWHSDYLNNRLGFNIEDRNAELEAMNDLEADTDINNPLPTELSGENPSTSNSNSAIREHYIITKNAMDDYSAWLIELPADYFANSIGDSVGPRGNLTQVIDSTELNENESAVFVKHAEADYQIWPVELPPALLENHVNDGFSCRGTLKQALHGVGLEDYYEAYEFVPPPETYDEYTKSYSGDDAEGPHESDSENYKAPTHSISIYIENAHDSNIGGFTLPLPTSPAELQPFLDGVEIADWQDMKMCEIYSDIDWLGNRLYDIASEQMTPYTLDELNYLAARVKELAAKGADGGIETFTANIEAGRNCGSIAEIINLTYGENINRFDLFPVYDAADYGDTIVNQFKVDEHADAFNRLKDSEIPEDRAFAEHIEKLEKHVDAAAFGRTVVKEEGGVFTEQGYLLGGDGMQKFYRGDQDIPAEHRLLTKPGKDIAFIMKIDDANISEAIVKLHAVGCRSMEYAAKNVSIFFDDHKRSAHSIDGNHLSNHYVLLLNRSDICITPAMEIYKRGSDMFKFALRMTGLAAKDERRPDIRMFAVRVNNSHEADAEKGGRDLRGDLIELNPKSFHNHITRYAATPDRVDALHDNGMKKSYDLFAWGQMLQQQNGDSAGLYTLHYPDAGLKEAAYNFGSFMGSHEMACHAESFEFHLPRIGAVYNVYNDAASDAGAETKNQSTTMIRIANEAAREILASGDADLYRFTDAGVVKLGTFEALRPMCFAEYHDLAIKHKDAAGLNKWAERKVGDIIRQAERDERKKSKNIGEEL